MKKVLIIFFVFTTIIIINACCNEYRYKSTLSKMEFVESTGVTRASNEFVLVRFRIIDEFTSIAMGSLIPESKADGTICNDQTIYEDYEDPIQSMFFSCDKDLVRKKANENLVEISFGYYLSRDESRRQMVALIVDDLNEPFKPNSVGRDFWFEVPASDFPATGNYKFTLQLKTMNGRVLEATSSDVYMDL